MTLSCDFFHETLKTGSLTALHIINCQLLTNMMEEDMNQTVTESSSIDRLRLLRVETQSLNNNTSPTVAFVTCDDLESNSVDTIKLLRDEVLAVKQEIKDIHESESVI